MDAFHTSEQKIIVALYIGTTKVTALVGRKNLIGKLELMGYGVAACEGVSRGTVSNIEKTAKAICDAIDRAEKSSRQEIRSVYAGISGEHIRSLHHQAVKYRDNGKEEINQEDIDQLVKDMHKIALPHGDMILHVIPQEFFIDNKKQGHIDPIGMPGARLEANFHIITASGDSIEQMRRAIEKSQIELLGLILAPTATAQAVLSDEEKELGVVLVDIGGGTTNVTIYHNGILRFTGVVPLGSNVITNDIKAGCAVLPDQAEKLKVRFGSAIAGEIVDNRIITVPGLMGRPPREISEKNLARIIQARVEELFDFVMWEIRRSGFEDRLQAGMVLTGGGSALRNINLLAELHTGLETRIGIPLERSFSHLADDVLKPDFSAPMGILLEAAGYREAEKMVPATEKAIAGGGMGTFEIEDGVENTQQLEEEHHGSGKNWLDRGIDTLTKIFVPGKDSPL
ncbi:MAG: cell division protein FtsA [Saprospiraceae bacterium]|nr:cell division protein FtsA [Saprospiraceae bacterium]